MSALSIVSIRRDTVETLVPSLRAASLSDFERATWRKKRKSFQFTVLSNFGIHFVDSELDFFKSGSNHFPNKEIMIYVASCFSGPLF